VIGRIAALGGGQGLSASLRALRRLGGAQITAVVTVADDGGSSGRLRADRGVLPPGDLRKALAALASADPADQITAELLQHRFDETPAGDTAPGDDPLVGHTVGNLLLCGLMEIYGDPVAAVAHAARLVRAEGVVLPMARTPLDIEADIVGADAGDPSARRVVRGQHEVAVTKGRVERVRLLPADPVACAEAVAAIDAADWLILGPGSWYTSVIPHLLVPEIAEAVTRTKARKIVVLNLASEYETASLSLPEHISALTRYLPVLRADVVVADVRAAAEARSLAVAAKSIGADLVLEPVAMEDGSPRHDPAALSAALGRIMTIGDLALGARS
jgi:uncharacterized cofD-like protein